MLPVLPVVVVAAVVIVVVVVKAAWQRSVVAVVTLGWEPVVAGRQQPGPGPEPEAKPGVVAEPAAGPAIWINKVKLKTMEHVFQPVMLQLTYNQIACSDILFGDNSILLVLPQTNK